MSPGEKDAFQKQNHVQVILAINLLVLNLLAILKNAGIVMVQRLPNNAETDYVQIILHSILMIYVKSSNLDV